MRPTKRQTGFTLIEIVVAISLLAAIMTILLTGFRLALNAWERGSKRIDAMGEELAGIQAVRVQVASAVPRTLSVTDNGRPIRYLCFSGSPHQVLFLAHRSWAGDRSHGLWLATARIVPEPDGSEQLVVNEAGVSGVEQLLAAFSGEDLRATRSKNIGDPAKRIEFFFWAAAPAGWVSDWKPTDQELLPSAIQVRWWRDKQVRTETFLIPTTEEAK